MPRLPVLSGDDFVKIVHKIGFAWDHKEGSHMILLDPNKRRLSVPRHKELSPGLLMNLIRDAGLTKEEFINLKD